MSHQSVYLHITASKTVPEPGQRTPPTAKILQEAYQVIWYHHHDRYQDHLTWWAVTQHPNPAILSVQRKWVRINHTNFTFPCEFCLCQKLSSNTRWRWWHYHHCKLIKNSACYIDKLCVSRTAHPAPLTLTKYNALCLLQSACYISNISIKHS